MVKPRRILLGRRHTQIRRRQRPRLTLVALALLTIVCALVALRLQPATGIGTLISGSSTDYRSTELDNRQFGAAPVVVLVRIPLTRLIQKRNLVPLSELEACLGGQRLAMSKQLGALEPVAAAHALAYGGSDSPCAALMRMRAAQVVYGPGTFLNRAVTAVSSEVRTLTTAAARTVQDASPPRSRSRRREGSTQARRTQRQSRRARWYLSSSSAQSASSRGRPRLRVPRPLTA